MTATATSARRTTPVPHLEIMSTGEFRQLAREGISSRFEAMAQIAEAWS
jgi:hypothetical protein